MVLDRVNQSGVHGEALRVNIRLITKGGFTYLFRDGGGGGVIKNPQLQHKQDDKYDIGDWQWGRGGGRAVTEQICSETQNKSALKTTFNLPPSFASGRSFPSWPGSYKQPLKGEMRN